MKVTVTSPTIHPIIVPTKSSLRSFNFYLVKHNHAVFLVDAGVNTDTCWEYFINTLQKARIELEDLDAIILTHNHFDHIGLVNRIRVKKEIPVYAHPDAWIRLKRESAFLNARISFFEDLYAQMGCGSEGDRQINRLKKAIDKNDSQKINGKICPLSDGEKIFGFDVIEVLGHAPDHIALCDEETGVLFASDLVIEHSSSNALVDLGFDGKRIKSLVQYESSLKKVAELPLKIIYSGHGETIKNPLQIIDQKLTKIENKADRLLTKLDESRTAAELAKLLYKDRYEKLFPLIMSEVVGHLDRLELLQKVEKEIRDGIFYYSVK
ncbi:MBL fold metallo-hydrolase [Pseudogracilibacillus sp. SO30301A]|uniref:MBL fold metallo-hydrolase n=1 Tax=Pseudogracilibacillus sp. SO30301A TaxID=3098291 RepID=UPI00300DC7FC